jgi:hypothetical protein
MELEMNWEIAVDQLQAMKSLVVAVPWEAIFVAGIVVFLIDHGLSYLKEKLECLRGKWYRWPYVAVLAIGIAAYCVHLSGMLFQQLVT